MVIGPSRSVEIKCRRCGKIAKSEDYVLDYVYKMMVCPSCIKERRAGEAKSSLKKEFEKQAEPTPEPQRPAGWDAEDEYLEKIARQKAKANGQEAPRTPSPYSTMGSSKQTQPHQSNAQPNTQPQASKPTSGSGMFGFFSGTTQKTVGAAPSSPKQEAPRQEPRPQATAQTTKLGGFGGVFGMFSGQTQKTVSGDNKFAPKDLNIGSHEPKISQSAPRQYTDMADLGLRSTGRAAPVQPDPAAPGRAEIRDNPDKTKYKCRKCGYQFWFNLETGTPKKCPYCSTEVNRQFM